MYNWVHTVAVVVQVLSALGVIILVLLQHGKGADMGAAFGSGASGSLFGATGSANFLSRTTGVLAGIFLASTLALAYMTNDAPRASDSLMQGVTPTSPASEVPVSKPPSVPPSGVPSSVPSVPSSVPSAPSSVPSPSSSSSPSSSIPSSVPASGSGSSSVPAAAATAGSTGSAAPAASDAVPATAAEPSTPSTSSGTDAATSSESASSTRGKDSNPK